jgi:putative transposase
MAELFKEQFRIDSSRLKGYDYSIAGAYFITICTKNQAPYFGEIVNNEMILNKTGELVKNYWLVIPQHFPYCSLDILVIMPNHLHGIIILNDEPIVETPQRGKINGVETLKLSVSTKDQIKRHPIGVIINQFKRICTINIRNFNPSFAWQTRYHDHIIRNETDLNRIRTYIINNLMNWERDEENR